MANETNFTGEGTLQPTPPTIQTPAPQNPAAPAAQPVQDGNTPGDTSANQVPPMSLNAHNEIIAQLQAQNAALMQQNNLLNQQVINLVQNGGQLNSVQQQPTQPQPAQPAATHPTQAEQLAAMGMQFEAQPSYMQPPASLSNAPDMALESLASDIGKDRPKH